jgi:hypothetical protein
MSSTPPQGKRSWGTMEQYKERKAARTPNKKSQTDGVRTLTLAQTVR